MAGIGDFLMSAGGGGLAGAGLGLVGGVVGSLINKHNQEKAAKQNYEYTRKLNEQQHELQQQMFDYTQDKTNAYNRWLSQNTALMQKQNLRNAGISTAMGEGGFNLAGATESGAGQLGAGSTAFSGFQGVDVAGPMMQGMSAGTQAGLGIARANAEVDLLNAQKVMEYFSHMKMKGSRGGNKEML